MKETVFQSQIQQHRNKLRTVENAISKTNRLVEAVVLPGKDPQIVAQVQSRLIERAIPFLTSEEEEVSEMVRALEAVDILEDVVTKVKSGVDEGSLSPVHLESLERRLEKAKGELYPGGSADIESKKRDEVGAALAEQFEVALPEGLAFDDLLVLEALLFGSKDKPVSRGEIHEHVWGGKYQALVAELKLSIAVSKIRRAFIGNGLEVAQDKENNGYFLNQKTMVEQSVAETVKTQRQIVISTERSITLTSKEQVVVTNLIDSISDKDIKDILALSGGDLESFVKDTEDISKLIAAYESGEIKIPDSGDFLEARESGRAAQMENVKKSIRGLLAFAITNNGEVAEPTTSLRVRIGREINKLKFYLSSIQGKEMIVKAISELSNIEATLMYHAMSTNIKKEMDFLDVDVCDETQMAEYFKVSAYHKFGIGAKSKRPKDDDYEMIEQLIMNCFERMEEEGFDVGAVMDELSEEDYADNMFERIVEAANYRNCLFELACVFSQSAQTSRLARYCREVLEGERDIPVPLWMKE